MRYITRDIEPNIIALSREYACLIITGPRQVGKSTVLEHLAEPERRWVTLDDIGERALARNDPALFLEIHRPPLTIDEVQYAPELFSVIKIAIDRGAPPGSFWLTGSHMFSLMTLAQESLAGRAAILQMTTLSQHEIYGKESSSPFKISLSLLKNRETTHSRATLPEIYERIWRGGMPGHVSGKFTNRDIFYSSFVASYINRDITDEIPSVDKFRFHDFIRAAACRTGQMLNIHAIATDVNVSDTTAKKWLLTLEKCGVIFFLRPYANNLLQRTVKTPKLYFFDTGLVAWLTRYSTPEILAASAINGAILENYVVAELKKSWSNHAQECLLWYYRDKEKHEIDLVMESDGELHPMEIKRSVNPGSELAGAFRILDKGSLPRGTGAILCLNPELSALGRENFMIPVWMI